LTGVSGAGIPLYGESVEKMWKRVLHNQIAAEKIVLFLIVSQGVISTN